MRSGSALDSPLVTVLRPGQLVTVLEQLDLGEGKLRARVVQVDEEAGNKAVAESWVSPDRGFDVQAEAAGVLKQVEKSQLGGGSSSLQLTMKSVE